MPQLFGRSWTKDELRRQVGRFEQLAGCSRYTLQEGFAQGVEVCELYSGSGLRFGVCPSRGMDIVFAEHNGRSLSWNSCTGIVHPAYYEAEGLGWLRGFAGGLLTTCGFSSFGPPCKDAGESYGIHDRASYLPAYAVQSGALWRDEETYEIFVEGKLRQSRVFGPNLTLTRRISTYLGKHHIVVQDRIENEGFEPEPMVVLYHCNFGFPVVAPGSVVRAPSQQATLRDAAAQEGADQWMDMEEAQPGYAERVYFHSMQPDDSGQVRAEIWNEALQFGAYVSYRAEQLPYFTQWKMMGAGTYVCGLEPSNAPLGSRADLKAQGQLPLLQPGEVKEVCLELGVVLP